ncbi:hypothetical protein D1867_08120 [Acidianus infernus]|uniref:Membrane protein 6-pyruvoyl-tetrahydropterin synthase-related domain-containing protein n=1 Tax=Acidianus infernus TaxID=12915 RepID=A0A6A9QEE6_ACIIN|nr:hypothetical protein [Acidianus infernus]MUM65199.1 hypothetical protein [Acidianus infernus]
MRRFYLFFIVTLVFYVIVFRTVFEVNAFSLIDTEPSYLFYRQYLFSITTPFSYFYNFLNSIWWNSPEKIFTVLPFILGTTLFYVMSSYFNLIEWKKWILSFLFMLNPGTALILYIGDAPGILMSYAFAPLVFLLGYRLAKNINLKNFLILSLVLIVANWIYFESFILDFIFLLPILFFASNKIKFLLASLASSALSFLSLVNYEVLVYEIVVPSLNVTNAHYIPLYVKEIYYISFYLGIFSIYLFIKKYKIPSAVVSVALILLLTWLAVFVKIPNIPLINAIYLIFESFQQKFILFISGLVVISFVFLKSWKYIFFILFLMSLANMPCINLYTQEHVTAYAILTFNANNYAVCEEFFKLQKFIYEHPGFYYIGINKTFLLECNLYSIYKYESLIPNLLPVSFSIFGVNAKQLAYEGIKYYLVVSNETPNYSNFKLVFSCGKFHLYENECFKSIAFSASGEPLNVTVTPCKVIVIGNSTFAKVLVPYYGLWKGARDCNGYLGIPMNKGYGEAINEAYYINQYLIIVDFIVLLIISGLLVKLCWSKLRSVIWLKRT